MRTQQDASVVEAGKRVVGNSTQSLGVETFHLAGIVDDVAQAVE